MDLLLCLTDHCRDKCIKSMLGRQREGVGAFEDGTVSFLGLAALPAGFAQVHRAGGFSAIAAHTAMLTRLRFCTASLPQKANMR